VHVRHGTLLSLGHFDCQFDSVVCVYNSPVGPDNTFKVAVLNIYAVVNDGYNDGC